MRGIDSKRYLLFRALLLIWTLVSTNPALARTIVGKVVGITDGDIITVLQNNQ